MKADVLTLKRPSRPVKPFVFTDPYNPGFAAHMTLKRFGMLEATAIEERAAEMYAKHVTGSGPLGDDGMPDPSSALYVGPEALPAIDGEPVVLRRGSCSVIAAVELAQTQEEAYTFAEIACMCACDAVAVQMQEAFAWVLPELAKKKEGADSPPDVSSPSL